MAPSLSRSERLSCRDGPPEAFQFPSVVAFLIAEVHASCDAEWPASRSCFRCSPSAICTPRAATRPLLSHPPSTLASMRLALDLDGVLCDLGPGLAARIEDRYGLTVYPSTWHSYDLSHLGLPEPAFRAFLDATFADPELYLAAPVCQGAAFALRHLRAAGWQLVG